MDKIHGSKLLAGQIVTADGHECDGTKDRAEPPFTIIKPVPPERVFPVAKFV